jgi:hypothetical protein
MWKPEEGCETHMRSLYSAGGYPLLLLGNAVFATWSRYWQHCSAALKLVSRAKADAMLPYDQNTWLTIAVCNAAHHITTRQSRVFSWRYCRVKISVVGISQPLDQGSLGLVAVSSHRVILLGAIGYLLDIVESGGRRRLQPAVC